MAKYSKGSANISVVMPTELLEELNDLAEDRGLSRNSLVVLAIRELIRAMREGKRFESKEDIPCCAKK